MDIKTIKMKYIIIILALIAFGCKHKEATHLGVANVSWDTVVIATNANSLNYKFKSDILKEAADKETSLKVKESWKELDEVMYATFRLQELRMLQNNSNSRKEYKKWEDSCKKYIKILKSKRNESKSNN